MFRSTSKLSPIAIDVGTGSVKMIQLECAGDQLRVIAAGKLAFPPNSRRTEDRQELVVSGIKDLLKSQGFKGRRAATIVPNHALQFKSFRVPKMPDEELEQVVLFEAEDRFAFQDTGAEYRYICAGEVRQGEEVRQEIIAMGCPGEVLNKHLSLFDMLKLSCCVMEVSPCAVVRSHRRPQSEVEDPNSVKVYVDVGQRATRIIITQGGEILFVKSINVGGDKLDELSAKELNLPLNEASQLRNEILNHYAYPEASRPAHLREDILDTAAASARPAFEQLGKEIGLCLRYFSVTFRGERPEELICVGGESYHPQLLKTVSEISGVKAVKGYPLKHIPADGVFSGADRHSGLLEWSTVIGLALREMPLVGVEKVAS